jgi:hypothetical protein
MKKHDILGRTLIEVVPRLDGSNVEIVETILKNSTSFFRSFNAKMSAKITIVASSFVYNLALALLCASASVYISSRTPRYFFAVWGLFNLSLLSVLAA